MNKSVQFTRVNRECYVVTIVTRVTRSESRLFRLSDAHAMNRTFILHSAVDRARLKFIFHQQSSASFIKLAATSSNSKNVTVSEQNGERTEMCQHCKFHSNVSSGKQQNNMNLGLYEPQWSGPRQRLAFFIITLYTHCSVPRLLY